MIKVEFHFDVGSPNAYLAHHVIPSVEQRTGVKFEYVPILLGGVFKLTNNRSPVESFAGVKNKLEYERLEMQRFVAQHRIANFTFNPHFPINTLTLMRGALAARELGVFERYIDAVFFHMWGEPKKMDDLGVAREALERSGLDASKLLEKTQDPAIKQALQINTEALVARGGFGAPTFFVNEAIYFGKDRLRDVEEAIQRSRAAEPR